MSEMILLASIGFLFGFVVGAHAALLWFLWRPDDSPDSLPDTESWQAGDTIRVIYSRDGALPRPPQEYAYVGTSEDGIVLEDESGNLSEFTSPRLTYKNKSETNRQLRREIEDTNAPEPSPTENRPPT